MQSYKPELVEKSNLYSVALAIEGLDDQEEIATLVKDAISFCLEEGYKRDKQGKKFTFALQTSPANPLLDALNFFYKHFCKHGSSPIHADMESLSQEYNKHVANLKLYNIIKE